MAWHRKSIACRDQSPPEYREASICATFSTLLPPREPEDARRAVRKAVPWILAGSLAGVAIVVVSSAYYLFVRHDVTMGLIGLGGTAYIVWKASHLPYLWKRGGNSSQ